MDYGWSCFHKEMEGGQNEGIWKKQDILLAVIMSPPDL